MDILRRSAVREQLNTIIVNHVQELKLYISIGDVNDAQIPAEILTTIDQLDDLCDVPVSEAQIQTYDEVRQNLDILDEFFRQMNQTVDLEFLATPVGKIWTEAVDWCSSFSRNKGRLSLKQVWDFLAPAVPDCLEDLGNGLYEARWWSPVPMMDLEILVRTDGVYVKGEPYEPESLPNGLAIRFSLSSSPLEAL